jgi:hypothetical protein
MKLWSVVVLLLALVAMSQSATAQDSGGEGLLANDARSITGGPLVTQAVPIEPGVTYSDAVADEQTRWYTLYVGEGQQVDVEMAEDGSLDYGCCVELRLFAPDQESDYGREGGYSEGEPKIYRTGTVEEGAVASGAHYVAVELYDFGPLDRELTYQLKVTVGESASSAADEDLAAPDPVDDGQQADGDSAPQEADGTAPESADQGSIDMLLTLLIVMGLLVLGLGAAVVYLLVRLARQ